MRLNKLFLLSVYTVSLCIGWGAPIIGAEIDEPCSKSTAQTVVLLLLLLE